MKERLQHLIHRALAPRGKDVDPTAYLRERVAPGLSVSGEPDLERVQSGANTTVLRWRTAEAGILYARIWPWKRQDRPVHQHQTAVELLQRAGLQTPEVLFADDSAESIRRWGLEVLVEREAQGSPLHRIGDRYVQGFEEVIRDLARLHAIEGKQWNKPWLRKQGFASPMAFWEERIARFRERVTPETCGLSDEEVQQSLALMRDGLKRAACLPPVVVHGDVSPGHMYLEGDRVTWIDLETVHFGRPEEDLAALGRNVTSAFFMAMLDIYERVAGREVDREALRTFSLMLQWERLNSRIQQGRRRRSLPSDVADVGGKRMSKLERDRQISELTIRRHLQDNVFLPPNGNRPQPPAT